VCAPAWPDKTLHLGRPAAPATPGLAWHTAMARRAAAISASHVSPAPGGLGRLRRAAGAGRSPQGCRDPGGDPGAEEVLGGVALALQPVTGFP